MEEKNKIIPLFDDQEILDLNNDTIEEEDNLLGIVSQNDDLLAFSIDGVYSDEKQTKYVTGKKLKDNPPVLRVSSGNGEQVEFLLTKEFSRMLLSSLQEVNKCYSGYKYVTKNATLSEKFKDIPKWFKEKPLEVIFTFGTIAFFLLIIIRSYFR